MDNPASPQSDSVRYPWIAGPLHLILVLVVEAAIAWRGVLSSQHMRSMVNPDRVQMYSRTIFFEWLVFAIVLIGVKLHGSSARTIVGERWRSALQVLRDIAIALAFWIISTLAISMLASHNPAGRAVQFLLPQGPLEMTLWAALSVTAGFCEEAVYRGYLQRQFTALTRNAPLGILLSAAAFGGAHAYQGLRGATVIAVQGALLGILARWCGTVRPGMLSHVWQDFFAGVLAKLLKLRVG